MSMQELTFWVMSYYSSRQSGGLSLAKILWQQWQYIINSQEYCQLKKWTIVGYYYDPLCKCTLALNKRQCAHMLKTCVYCTVHSNQKYLTKTSFKNLIKTKSYSASTSQANQRHMVAQTGQSVHCMRYQTVWYLACFVGSCRTRY